MNLTPASALRGEIRVPGDKSISHRGVMLGAIADGVSHIHGFLDGADCRSTIECFSRLGVNIETHGSDVTVHGKGLCGLRRPEDTLYTGNSGTTTRLITGLLAGQRFDTIIDGDATIRRRPMKHIKEPLSQMGAHIEGDFCPITVHGGPLHAIRYTLPVASAQLKSAILLASLYADGETVVTEPQPSRDHTERMLSHMGSGLIAQNGRIISRPPAKLDAVDITVPGDISSAAFFLVAGAILPNSQITVLDVGVNPTRTGILDVLAEMGADIKIENQRSFGGEPVADITVSSSVLHGVTIGGDLIPRLIDELPVAAVAAAFAEGTTVIQDAQQLKVKESDRIAAVTAELARAGADITATDDGMVIRGGRPIHGAAFSTYHDHRMAMSMAVLALAAEGESDIENPEVVDISFPGFFDLLGRLGR